MGKKLKIVLWAVAILLVIFQGFVYWVEDTMEYVLIYDWIFYVINYVIALILFLAYINNRYLKWIQWMIALIILVSNTVFFYYMGDVNLVVSKSKDQQHEIILKEYKKMKNETVRLQRRDFLFGRKMDTLMGSSSYKTIEKETYNINWVNGDTAVLVYKVSSHGPERQAFISFRTSDLAGYHNIGVSLTGKWVEHGNPRNTLMYDGGEIVYAKNGKLYYYRDGEDTEQLGTYGIKIIGDKNMPTFTVILNSDSKIGQNNLIMDGGTITLCSVNSKCHVYVKEGAGEG